MVYSLIHLTVFKFAHAIEVHSWNLCVISAGNTVFVSTEWRRGTQKYTWRFVGQGGGKEPL